MWWNKVEQSHIKKLHLRTSEFRIDMGVVQKAHKNGMGIFNRYLKSIYVQSSGEMHIV